MVLQVPEQRDWKSLPYKPLEEKPDKANQQEPSQALQVQSSSAALADAPALFVSPSFGKHVSQFHLYYITAGSGPSAHDEVFAVAATQPSLKLAEILDEF